MLEDMDPFSMFNCIGWIDGFGGRSVICTKTSDQIKANLTKVTREMEVILWWFETVVEM